MAKRKNWWLANDFWILGHLAFYNFSSFPTTLLPISSQMKQRTPHIPPLTQNKGLLTLVWWPGASLQGQGDHTCAAWAEVGGGESAVCACPILSLSTDPPGLVSVILKVNNNHNRQPIIASLSGWEVYNLNSWQREKLAQSLGVMVHGEPVGHDCYLMQGNQAAVLNIRRH